MKGELNIGPWEIVRYERTTMELYTVSRMEGSRRVHMECDDGGQPRLWSLERAKAAVAASQQAKGEKK